MLAAPSITLNMPLDGGRCPVTVDIGHIKNPSTRTLELDDLRVNSLAQSTFNNAFPPSVATFSQGRAKNNYIVHDSSKSGSVNDEAGFAFRDICHSLSDEQCGELYLRDSLCSP